MRSLRSISVLLPTWPGIELLERSLAALAAQRCALPWDLRIDGGCDEATSAALESWAARFPVPVALERFAGLDRLELDRADVRNLLAARSAGDLLLFVGEHAIPARADWLETLAASFADERFGAVWFRGVPPGEPRSATGRRELRLHGEVHDVELDREARRVLASLDRAACALRRDLWERHPFPRTPSGEDALQARALLEAGYTVVVDEAAIDERARDRDTRTPDVVHAASTDARPSAPDPERTRMLDTQRLKVLYVALGFPPDTWGGSEVYTLNLAHEIVARGHEVVVLTRATADRTVAQGGPPDFSVREELFEGLRVLRVTNRLQYRSLREGYVDTRAETVFLRALEREKPDVVHFQHVIHLSASLVELARREAIATIFTLHDYWGVCARTTLLRPNGVRCEGSQGAGCLLCARGDHLETIGSGRADLLAASYTDRTDYVQLMQRHEIVPAAYAAADLLVAPSRFLRRKYLETGAYDPRTLLYSTYGMRVDASARAAKRPDPEGRVRFGFIGTIVRHKGVTTLLDAMRRLAGRDCVLHVFGDYAPDADEYHAGLRALAGPNVVFHGRFDNARVAAVHAEIDVLVVPSIWFENAPITIQEAHVFGTPVVVSDIGGMAELVRDGVDGLHFAVEDDADLAAKLARFLDEPGLVAALSRDFPRRMTIEEDALITELRYRQLACVARTREPGPGTRLLVDVPGIETAARAGGADPQGADLLLLRPATGAAAEYDVEGAGGGPRRIRIEQLAVEGEHDVELGVRVSVDGVRVGDSSAVTSGGPDGVRMHEFEHDFPPDARRLRVEPLPRGPGETCARIARVQVVRLPRAPEPMRT